jgi:hypothetical protein
VVYRKGELSKGTMDRQWPHQVALPAARCSGHNYVTVRLFCEDLSLCPRTHSFRRRHARLLLCRPRSRRAIPQPLRRRTHRPEVATKVAGLKWLICEFQAATTEISVARSASSSTPRWRSSRSAGAASTSECSTPPTTLLGSAKTVRPYCCASTFAAASAAERWRTFTSLPDRRCSRTQSNVTAPQHFLNFFPDPQGHGSLRPTFLWPRRGVGASLSVRAGACRRAAKNR